MLKNIVRGIAVGLLTLSLTVAADAKPKSGGGNKAPGGQSVQFQNKSNMNYKSQNFSKSSNKSFDFKKFGKPVNPSFCYKGKDFCFWNHCCWCDWMGCQIYWCPKTCHWFYYYEPDCCYYIVEECPCY